jgi:hypothetical protein
MAPRYRVTLTSEEREELATLTKTTRTNAKRFLYARALLLCDAGPEGPAWTVADTAEAMGVTSRTIEHLKRCFVEEGMDAALERKKPDKSPRAVVFDGTLRVAAYRTGLFGSAGRKKALDRPAARGEGG